ncbi:hypothetical protein N7536_007499 [Penicillium majusculum]|nr:hypothetical protein N7536_007499 [Penicillium majusculum]
MASQTRYVDRVIPCISMHDFEDRIDEITDQLIQAAENVRFFTLIGHGISKEHIDSMFAISKTFFDLPDDVKATVPWNPNNVGWEKNSQIRPSTGQPDSKESYQLQFGENMNDLWVKYDDLPGFRTASRFYESRPTSIGMFDAMLCAGPGVPGEILHRMSWHFTTELANHYASTPLLCIARSFRRQGVSSRRGTCRLGLSDFTFPKGRSGGLEICPGREVVTEFGIGDGWTKLKARTGEIEKLKTAAAA